MIPKNNVLLLLTFVFMRMWRNGRKWNIQKYGNILPACTQLMAKSYTSEATKVRQPYNYVWLYDYMMWEEKKYTWGINWLKYKTKVEQRDENSAFIQKPLWLISKWHNVVDTFAFEVYNSHSLNLSCGNTLPQTWICTEPHKSKKPYIKGKYTLLYFRHLFTAVWR